MALSIFETIEHHMTTETTVTHLDFRMLIMQDLGLHSEQIACIVVSGICSLELVEVAERRHTAALPADSSAAWLRKSTPESWHVSFVPGPMLHVELDKRIQPPSNAQDSIFNIFWELKFGTF